MIRRTPLCGLAECFDKRDVQMRITINNQLYWKLDLCREHHEAARIGKLDLQVAILDAIMAAAIFEPARYHISPRPS